MEKATKKMPSFSPEINMHSKKIVKKLANETDSLQGLSDIGYATSRTTRSMNQTQGDFAFNDESTLFKNEEKPGNTPLERMILDTKIVKLKDNIKKKYKGKTVNNLIEEDEFNDDIKLLTEMLELKKNLGF